MAFHELKVIPGGRARGEQPKELRTQDAIAKRFRTVGRAVTEQSSEAADVIPLLDGWIRRLEREAGLDEAANER